MSKRLQVLLDDYEYGRLQKWSKARGQAISDAVRQGIRLVLKQGQGTRSPEERIALFQKFAKFNGPTGDILQLLGEIEKGRNI